MSQQQFRPSGFGGMPPVTKYILGINIFLFVLKYVVASSFDLDHYLALYYFKSQYFKPYQLVTHMFVHGGFTHILFNMMGLYSFGSILERLWGSKRFLNFYLLCGLGAALAQLGSNYYTDFQLSQMNLTHPDDIDTYKYIIDNMACVGASGAVFGLLAIFGVLFPEMDIFLLFFRVQARNAVWISLVVGYGLSLLMDTHISNTCNLGGALSGYLFHFLFLKNSQNRKIFSPNFSKEARVKSQAFKNSAIGKDEDIFEDQIRKNESLLKSLEINNFKDKEAILIPIQVPSANICPSVAFNPEDSICRRCEWLPNCALRKLKESN